MTAYGDLKVLEVGDFVSVAYCGKLLRGLGAAVTKVELPQGDLTRHMGPFPNGTVSPETSGTHLFLNAGKESVTLDYTNPAGRAVLLQLIGAHDVLITNLDLATRKRLSLTYDDVTPPGGGDLIYTAISVFGDSGPRAEWKGHGITVWSGAGMAGKFGEAGREPLNKPLAEVDYLVGLNGAGATLMAVAARDRGLGGQHVDISGMDCLAELMNGLSLNAVVFEGRPFPSRTGHKSAVVVPWGVYPCKDGYFEVFCPMENHWIRFAEVLADPELQKAAYRDRQHRTEHEAEIERVMLPWLASHTKAELVEICTAARLPFHPLYRIDEVFESPQLAARDYFVTIDHPLAGAWRYPGAPFKSGWAIWEQGGRAPLLGEHTVAVLSRHGYDTAAIVGLAQSRLI